MRYAKRDTISLRERAFQFWDDVEGRARLPNDAFAAVTSHTGIYGVAAARAELIARA